MKDALVESLISMSQAETVALAADYVCPHRVRTLGQIGRVPVMAKREGCYWWDDTGKRFFDVHINGGTYSLGHRHPEVLASLKAGLEYYDVGNHHFPSGPRARLAQRLKQLAPGDLHYSLLAPSGSEAVDLAIRTARYGTGRRKIVSLLGSFHGHTSLALAAGDVNIAQKFHVDSGEFQQVAQNDLRAMEQALASGDVAAVLIETIPATRGFTVPVEGYLAGVKRLCVEHGALYIADEVQTGLGRSGKFWAVEHYGVEPDLLVTGKGLSAGLYPVAAVLVSRRVGAWLDQEGWGYVSTFGGSELGCIVALKVLEILSRPQMLPRVNEVAQRLQIGLETIRRAYPKVLREVRQQGLVMALVFSSETQGQLAMVNAYARGLWVFVAGFDKAALQFKPPVIVSDAQVDELLNLVEDTVSSLSGVSGAISAARTGARLIKTRLMG